MNPLSHTKAFLQYFCEHNAVSMNPSDSLQDLVSQVDLAESLAADPTFQNCYDAVEAAAFHIEYPQLLQIDEEEFGNAPAPTQEDRAGELAQEAGRSTPVQVRSPLASSCLTCFQAGLWCCPAMHQLNFNPQDAC